MSRFRIRVYENSHYMDESESYELDQEYEDCETAIAACKRIVDEFLAGSHREGMAAGELWDQYSAFGEDPTILPADCPFSAWSYARLRCDEICRK